jgi:hypothetical protein
MIDEKAIQRAHDVMHFLGSPQAPAIFDEEAALCAHACHDALAWVLGYPCGEAFQDNLDGALAELRKHGYLEVDAGQAVTAAEARKRGLM